MARHEDLTRTVVREKLSERFPPNPNLFSEEDLERLRFQRWRHKEKKFVPPVFGDQIILDPDQEYCLLEPRPSKDFEYQRLDDIQLLGRSLSLASSVTADHILADPSRQRMSYESPSGNHLVHLVSFPSYKGTITLQFHETDQEKDEHLSVTIQETLSTRSGNPYEYTRLNGFANLHTDNFELNFTPNPRRSSDILTYHYTTDDYGVSYLNGALMGDTADEFLEAMSLYRTTQI